MIFFNKEPIIQNIASLLSLKNAMELFGEHGDIEQANNYILDFYDKHLTNKPYAKKMLLLEDLPGGDFLVQIENNTPVKTNHSNVSNHIFSMEMMLSAWNN